MKKISIYLLFIFAISFLFAEKTLAVCPICTIAVGAGVGLSRWLWIDDAITGLWVGGLIVSMITWTESWLEKKYPLQRQNVCKYFRVLRLNYHSALLFRHYRQSAKYFMRLRIGQTSFWNYRGQFGFLVWRELVFSFERKKLRPRLFSFPKSRYADSAFNNFKRNLLFSNQITIWITQTTTKVR